MCDVTPNGTVANSPAKAAPSTLRTILSPPPTRPNVSPTRQTPAFRLLEPQPIRPVARVLALLLAAGAAYGISHGLQERRARQVAEEQERASRSSDMPDTADNKPMKDDDPNQVDTIVMGDAGDAPVPARKHGISNVHATILIHLPRFGPEQGLIPDSPAGHLLYNWLAAFNQGSDAALTAALPNAAPNASAAAQMVLRLRTGGLRLLYAREIQPGLLVFRLRDQTPQFNEVLGSLQMVPGSSPPKIATFSLRAVDTPPTSRAQR